MRKSQGSQPHMRERKGIDSNGTQHQTLPDTLISRDILHSPQYLFGRMYVQLHFVHVGACVSRAI